MKLMFFRKYVKPTYQEDNYSSKNSNWQKGVLDACIEASFVYRSIFRAVLQVRG